MEFHHHGLAVSKEESALRFLEVMGYQAGQKVYDPAQKVYLRLCTSQTMPTVEIVTPGEEQGPLTAVLKRAAEMLYHTCYTTENIQQSVEKLEAAGIRCFCVSPPKPAVLFGGRLVSFYNVAGFGLIEFLETGTAA